MTATTAQLTVTCPTWCRDHGEPERNPGRMTDMCLSDFDEDQVTLSLEPEYDFTAAWSTRTSRWTCGRPSSSPTCSTSTTGPVQLNIGRNDDDVARTTLDEADAFFRKGTALVAEARAEARR